MSVSGASNTTPEILAAGAFAAFTIDLLVYPLDSIKTRIQSKDYTRLFVNETTKKVNRAALFRGLYQGVGSVIIATLPSSGSFFLTYESTKSLIGRVESIPAPIANSAASSVAELVSCAILTPAEVIKQNAQMSGMGGASPTAKRINVTIETLKKFRRQPSALFQGYAALAGRNLPFTAIQFPIFEHFKATVKQHRQKNGTWTGSLPEHSLVTASSAGLAGSFAALLTTPIDVIKTRIMLEASTDAPRRGTLQVFRDVWQESGVRGLMKGGALRAVWTMLASGLYLGVYDFGRVYLAKRRGVDVSNQEFF